MRIDEMRTQRSEHGETLVEILVALVIIGLVVTAYFATFSTSTTGSTAQRSLVTADAVLRTYAEKTKDAVRTQCLGGSTFSVPYSPPGGFTVNPLSAQSCPPSSTSSTASQPWSPIVLTVTLPNAKQESMSIVVRTP
jgi:prepilin-type N-terminal cleavage/methylation domain-containing protein